MVFNDIKGMIQADFDAVYSRYPTQLARKPIKSDDPYKIKNDIYEIYANACPVHIFPHYPYYFEVDTGSVRYGWNGGLGQCCFGGSGVDFAPLRAFMKEYNAAGLVRINDYNDYYHRSYGYEKLLKAGLRGIYEECEKLNSGEGDAEKYRFRQTVMMGCKAVKTVCERISAEAYSMLDSSSADDISRKFIKRIALTSATVPWEPPTTFYEAANTLLFLYRNLSDLEGVSINSLGPLDRLLYPYYKRDLEKGLITRGEAYFLIQCLLFYADARYNFSNPYSGLESAITVMIGGRDGSGKAVFNDITRMIVGAYCDNNFVSPKLNARIFDDTDSEMREYTLLLSNLVKNGCNVLAVENDDIHLKILTRMGIRMSDAVEYVGCGCQEIVARGQSHSRAFTYVNLPQILLDTFIQNGRESFYGAAGVFLSDYFSFSELYDAYFSNLRAICAITAEKFRPYEALHSRINPEPMISASIDDCLTRGKDVSEGGARYYNKTFSFTGFGTLCDSLIAIKAYIDENNSIDELRTALKTNFCQNPRLRQKLKSYGYYGSDNAADSELTMKTAERLAHITKGIFTWNNIQWGTSLFNYYLYNWFGVQTGATSDGRDANTPFTRGFNPSEKALDKLTQALNSAGAIDMSMFDDTAIFDFTLPCGTNDISQSDIAAVISAGVKLGIPTLQINSAKLENLIEERDHPGTHPDIVVRVCGYSARFHNLDPQSQNEVIGRFRGA